MNIVTSQECATYLGLPLQGKNINIDKVANIEYRGGGALLFMSSFNIEQVDKLNQHRENFLIANSSYEGLLNIPHVLSDNPRLDFCKLTNQYFRTIKSPKIEKSAYIGDNVKIGKDVYIGHNVVIEENVRIGDNTRVLHNVVICENTKIGKNCLIKSGSIIGQKGFGFERDESGVPIEFTHYGKVLIGNNVEIGALNTVVAGVLSDTVVGDYVKTDDHVHIAHNVEVGKSTLITAASVISGSVRIGKQAWLAPNCTIINKISLGNQLLVGIGAVVTKSFPEKVVIAGTPAKIIRRMDNDENR